MRRFCFGCGFSDVDLSRRFLDSGELMTESKGQVRLVPAIGEDESVDGGEDGIEGLWRALYVLLTLMVILVRRKGHSSQRRVWHCNVSRTVTVTCSPRLI